jgi:pimeloyl-ACP methyl ester carboxylesterase
VNTVFKGLPVHYEIFGEGLPLIFLHGFNENSNVWDLIIPNVSKHNQCIVIDLPGFGKSPLPANLTIKYMADAVYRIIEELNLLKPIVIGHSMGGYISLDLVHIHPELLKGVGLFHSTTFADSDEKKDNRLKTIEFLDKNPVEAFFKVFIPGLFAPQNLKSELLILTENVVKQTHKESVIAGTKAMLERSDRTDVLKNSHIPWLFIAGQYDQLIPMEQISLQASYCNKAMFEILFNSGHIGMIEEPDKSSEIILNFAEWCFN